MLRYIGGHHKKRSSGLGQLESYPSLANKSAFPLCILDSSKEIGPRMSKRRLKEMRNDILNVRVRNSNAMSASSSGTNTHLRHGRMKINDEQLFCLRKPDDRHSFR